MSQLSFYHESVTAPGTPRKKNGQLKRKPVPFHGGDYYDARFNKRNQVVPLIVEAFGGIARRGARCLRYLGPRPPRFLPEARARRHHVQPLPPGQLPLAPPR